MAPWFGKEAVTAQLLQSMASVSAVDSVYGWTPLHYAAYYGKSSIANLLLQANASPTAVNKYGDTPAQCAKQRGQVQGRRTAVVHRADTCPGLQQLGCYCPFAIIGGKVWPRTIITVPSLYLGL